MLSGAGNESKKEIISWYVSFVDNYYPFEKLPMKALLPQVEHCLISPDKKFKIFSSFKALLGSILLDTYIHPMDKDSGTKVFFWPFQLHHPTFQILVYKKLKEEGIQCQTIVFREDLIPVLQEYEVDAVIVRSYRRPRPVKKVLLNLFQLLNFFLFVFKEPVPWLYKKAMIQSWVHLGIVKKAEAAAIAVMRTNNFSYHLVGYDLSIVGRTIIELAKKYNHRSARIQNGAVNYRMAGYSEVDDLFLWDEESEKAYKSNGYKGNTLITGNILEQEKYPAGNAFPQMNPILINGYSHRVLVAFSGPGHNTSEKGHIASLLLLLRLVRDNTKVLFVVKLHPKDKDHYYETLKKENNVRMATDLFPDNMPNAINFIHATDLVITGASSVALDAINLNKAVISIDPLDELQHFEFLKHPNVRQMKKIEDIPDLTIWIDESPRAIIDSEKKEGLKMIVQEITRFLEMEDIREG